MLPPRSSGTTNVPELGQSSICPGQQPAQPCGPHVRAAAGATGGAVRYLDGLRLGQYCVNGAVQLRGHVKMAVLGQDLAMHLKAQ